MNQKITPPPSQTSLDDPLIRVLAMSIRYAVRILAVLMVLVIWWGGGGCGLRSVRTCL